MALWNPCPLALAVSLARTFRQGRKGEYGGGWSPQCSQSISHQMNSRPHSGKPSAFSPSPRCFASPQTRKSLSLRVKPPRLKSWLPTAQGIPSLLRNPQQRVRPHALPARRLNRKRFSRFCLQSPLFGKKISQRRWPLDSITRCAGLSRVAPFPQDGKESD